MQKRRLISEEDIKRAIQQGLWSLEIDADAVVTPLAMDTARSKGLELIRVERQVIKSATGTSSSSQVVSIGSDHRGYRLKSIIARHLINEGREMIDVGCDSDAVCDYPAFAYAVAGTVQSGKAGVGIVIDGAGIGSAIVANKVSGIRAAHCHDPILARNARQHNDANVLTVGALMIGESAALEIVRVFLETSYAGGRHENRIEMIRDIERGWRETTSPQ